MEKMLDIFEKDTDISILECELLIKVNGTYITESVKDGFKLIIDKINEIIDKIVKFIEKFFDSETCKLKINEIEIILKENPSLGNKKVDSIQYTKMIDDINKLINNIVNFKSETDIDLLYGTWRYKFDCKQKNYGKEITISELLKNIKSIQKFDKSIIIVKQKSISKIKKDDPLYSKKLHYINYLLNIYRKCVQGQLSYLTTINDIINDEFSNRKIKRTIEKNIN